MAGNRSKEENEALRHLDNTLPPWPDEVGPKPQQPGIFSEPTEGQPEFFASTPPGELPPLPPDPVQINSQVGSDPLPLPEGFRELPAATGDDPVQLLRDILTKLDELPQQIAIAFGVNIGN